MKEAKPSSKGLRQMFGVTAVATLALGGVLQAEDYATWRALAREEPDRIPSIPKLESFAEKRGRDAFLGSCATCHGENLRGSREKGVPDLTDNDWLYDTGRVSDIERTILYGIRSGNGKAHNVTDMPPVGRQRTLAPDEVDDVVAYVLTLSGGKADAAAAERGSKLFQDKGVCYDCHGRDGEGISDYGAPNLTDNTWTYGGDAKAISASVYDGRHGVCPAWIGKLSFMTIRAIAVYIHSASKEAPASPAQSAAAAP